MFALDLMRGNLCSVAIAWNFGIYRFEGFASHPSFGKCCLGAYAWEISLVTFSKGTFAWEFEMLSLGISGVGSSVRENQSQETRFDDFLAFTPEVKKATPRNLDLMTFRPWLRKSMKSVPGESI